MLTYEVVFTNRYGFRVITYHHSAISIALRLDELAQAGVDVSQVEVRVI